MTLVGLAFACTAALWAVLWWRVEVGRQRFSDRARLEITDTMVERMTGLAVGLELRVEVLEAAKPDHNADLEALKKRVGTLETGAGLSKLR